MNGTALSFAIVLWFAPGVALAQETEETAPVPAVPETETVKPAVATDDESQNTKKGKIVLRGSANLDAGKTINLGGADTGGSVNGGVGVGIGYFILPKLSLDIDADLRFQLAPDQEVTTFGITPGARWYPVPQIYVRAGLPLVFIVRGEFDLNLGVLVGAGYRQPLGSKAYFILGIDYTYWLTGSLQAVAPNGRIDLTAGVQTHF